MKICPYCSEKIQESAKKCRFCWEWLEIEKLNNKIEEKPQKENKVNSIKDKKSIKVGFKSKLLNFIILLIYFVLVSGLSLLYTLSSKVSELIEKDYSSVASYYFTNVIIFFFLWRWLYKKSRWDLVENFKENLKKSLKWCISLCIILLLILWLYVTQKDINSDYTTNDMKNISEKMLTNIEDIYENPEQVIQTMNEIETESLLWNNIQSYIKDKANISSEYQESINSLWQIYVADWEENDLNKIYETIENLKKLRIISQKYKESTEQLKNKYKDLIEAIETEKTKEIDKLENIFLEKEENYIDISLRMYEWLLTVEDEIEIVNWMAMMESESAQWLWREWLEKYIVAQEEYAKAENDILSYRQELLEELQDEESYY